MAQLGILGREAYNFDQEMFAEIARMLDEAAGELVTAGDRFAFALSNGYAGFTTPATVRTFNRAIRARVAVYTQDYETALTALEESFLIEMPMTLAELDVGVYHSYSTGPGDQVNNLINPNIFAHPSLVADVMMDGAMVDASPPASGGVRSLEGAWFERPSEGRPRGSCTVVVAG
ncbi:MAG: hypothetical protein M3680_06940 [Myxococcota bacterium]|nr:hypothetical protein [Myxococcota bacterium]